MFLTDIVGIFIVIGILIRLAAIIDTDGFRQGATPTDPVYRFVQLTRMVFGSLILWLLFK
jgi:hypothetical protein